MKSVRIVFYFLLVLGALVNERAEKKTKQYLPPDSSPLPDAINKENKADKGHRSFFSQ